MTRGGVLGAQRPHLGNRDLEVGQHLEQIGLEGLVGAVQLVDQQHRRALRIGLEGLQQRPFDEEAVREDIVLDGFAVFFSGRLGEPDLDHLVGIVPLVDGGGDVEALVTLQAQQAAPQGGGQHLADLRLADPRLAFQEQRAVQAERQVKGGRQAAVGEIVALLEESLGFVHGRGQQDSHGKASLCRERGLIPRSIRNGAPRVHGGRRFSSPEMRGFSRRPPPRVGP